MNRLNGKALLLLALAGGLCAARGSEAPWPRFRGPHGAGIGHGNFPVHFGPGTNLAWQTPLPSGHSSPSFSSDRIFLTGFSGNKLQTICLAQSNGAVLWLKELDPGPIEKSSRLSSPATATPATDGRRVVVYFGSFGLISYDLDGRELWRKPLPVPVTQHGAGVSPILAQEKVLLPCDQDTGSYLLCVDARDGATLWKTARPGFKRGFATPLLYPAQNPAQIILPGSLRLVSYNLQDGTERWSAAGLPNEMVASAVESDGLIIAGGWTHGSGVKVMPLFDGLLAADKNGDGMLTRDEAPTGPAKQHFHYLDANKDGLLEGGEYEGAARLFDASQNAVLAVRPDGFGDVTTSAVQWKFTRGLPYCPTPLACEGKIYLVKNGGLFTCLDAKTGQPFYQEERIGALGDYYASPVAAEGKICVISQPGTAVVLKAGPVLEVLARNPLGEPVVASPAILNNCLYVRSETHLFCFTEQQNLNLSSNP